MRICSLLVLWAVCLLTNAVPDWTNLNEIVQEAIINKAFPGASIVVANQTTVLYKKNYGRLIYQNEIHDIEVGNDTKYDVASLTKVMATVLCLMNLASSGSLKIDDLVSKYITNYDTNKKGATTLGNLLLHNAGLPYDYPGNLPKTPQEVIQYITFSKPEYPIGTKFQYSNLGYIMLGEVIAKVSKKSLNAYFEQNKIFAGLKDTFFNPSTTQLYKTAPTEFDTETRHRIVRGEAHQRLAYFLGGVAGHSGLFSTSDDVSRYIRLMLSKGKIGSEGRVLPEAIVTQFTTKVTGLSYDNARTYGFDTNCPSSKMTDCLGHDGSTGIMAWADRAKKVTFVLLSNRGHPDVKNSLIDSYKSRIADAIFTALGY